MTLIYIPKPYNDESAASLIMRIAEKNGYKTTSSLLKAYNVNVYISTLNSYFFNSEKFTIVLKHLNLDKKYIILAPSQYGPTKKIKKLHNNIIIYESLLTADGGKICVSCLKENDYLRINWMIKPLTICLKHNRKLLENCPQCNSKLNSNRNCINTCNYCNYNFTKYTQEVVSPLEINANIWLMNTIKKNDLNYMKKVKSFFDIINNTRKTFKNIKLFNPNVILGYLYFENKEKYQSHFISFLKENLSLAHPRILAIYFISSYQDISSIHENILANYKFQKEEENYDYHNILLSQRSSSIALKVCKSNLKNNYFPNLESNSKISSKLIEDFIIGKKKQSLGIKALPDIYCDTKRLSKLLCLNYETSCMLLHRSNIFHLEKITINSKKIIVTKLKNVENFDKKYITSINLAQLLKLPTHNLYNKLKLLDIYPKFGPSIDNTPLNIYLRKDIKHITNELISSILNNRKNNPLECYLSKEKNKEILRISNLLNINKFEIKKLIKFDILKLDCSPPSRRFRIEEKSLSKLLSIINNENYISVKNAIEITNSPANWFYRYWVETGFVEIIDLCIWKLVKKEQVDEVLRIKNDFFTGKEASQFLGMPHSHITNLMSQKLILPYEFGIKNTIKLFKKKDVFDLKEKGYGY